MNEKELRVIFGAIVSDALINRGMRLFDGAYSEPTCAEDRILAAAIISYFLRNRTQELNPVMLTTCAWICGDLLYSPEV